MTTGYRTDVLGGLRLSPEEAHLDYFVGIVELCVPKLLRSKPAKQNVKVQEEASPFRYSISAGLSYKSSTSLISSCVVS